MDFDTLIIIAAAPVIAILIWDVVMLVRWSLKQLGKKADTPTKNANQESKSSIIRTVGSVLWRFRLPLIHVAVGIFSLAVLAGALSPAPRIESSYPEWESAWENYDQPIELVFNVPVQISNLNPFLSNQQLAGNWDYEPYLGFLPVTRVARFYPETSLPQERRLVVYMTGVNRLGVDEYHEHPLNLFTHNPVEINFTNPVNESTEVATESEIEFSFNKPNSGLYEWEFEIEPEVEFNLEEIDDSGFKLIPTEDLAQTQDYVVSAFRTSVVRNLSNDEIVERDNREKVHEIRFLTVKAPLLKKATPNGTGIKVDTDIRLEFETAMNQASVESLLSIEPELDVQLVWENNYKLALLPTSELPKETKYTISLPAGVESLNGGLSETAIEHSFTTIGAVRVTTFEPKNNTVRVARNSNIKVTFDQAVDKSSAQSKFSISPNKAGKFTWKDNTLIFNPTGNLAFNTTYTIRVASGVKTVDGLDSNKAFTSKFTTVPNQTIVAGFDASDWDRQDYNFSCGIAALKMALSWKGVSTTENALIGGIIPQYTGSMTGSCASGGTCTWANPNKYFVGLGNGSGTYGAGQSAYGVHWLPVMDAYSHFGVSTELRRNWNTAGLAQELSNGHPVQIWWWNGVSSYYGSQGGRRIDWVDVETGQNVEAIHGMHSILVIGYNGDPTNPTSFIVLDPWWGYNTYSVAQFNNQWPKLQNTGVIIY